MRSLKMFLGAIVASTLIGCASVEVGSVGVVTDTMSGQIDKLPLGPGFHVIGFFKRMYEFPAGVVDNLNLDNFKVNTREGQEITVDIRVQYQPNLSVSDTKAVDLFKRYRKTFDGESGLVHTRWIQFPALRVEEDGGQPALFPYGSDAPLDMSWDNVEILATAPVDIKYLLNQLEQQSQALTRFHRLEAELRETAEADKDGWCGDYAANVLTFLDEETTDD